jgi:putative Flp pilus-assembly TadE/G-like protein
MMAQEIEVAAAAERVTAAPVRLSSSYLMELLRDRRGAAMALMTMLLLLPLGLLTAYFTDSARLFVMRVQMQVAADAAALAGASGFIDGDEDGDSVEARAAHYVTLNPVGSRAATLESLTVDLDSGTINLVLSHATGPLLFLPRGMTVRVHASAKAGLAGPGEIGRPIHNGNAFGWWKHDKDKEIHAAGSDSGLVRLGS